MELTGKIRRIGNIQHISDRFMKREFVLEYSENPTYPQIIKFELLQHNVEAIEGYDIGDVIKVHFNLKGKEVKGKKDEVLVFNTLEAWRLEPAKKENTIMQTNKNNEIKDDEYPF